MVSSSQLITGHGGSYSVLEIDDKGRIEKYRGGYLIDTNGVLYDDIYRVRATDFKRIIKTNFTHAKRILRNGQLWGWGFTPSDFLYIGNRYLPTSMLIEDYVRDLLEDPSKETGYPLGLQGVR
jgi:hypothetical protein